MKKRIFAALVSLLAETVFSSNLATPGVNIPEARVSIGVSYHLGGYTITNKAIPSIWNRLHSRVEYAPLNLMSIGIELGATQIDVDQYFINSDTLPGFHGKFGLSGGADLKLSSPAFIKDRLRFTCISKASFFSSKNNHSAKYKGIDGTAVLGLQIHIPGFGYVTTGPLLYLIDGKSISYTGKEAFFSNTNNLRGWIAIDFFPHLKEITTNKPFVSLEISVSPEIDYSKRVPVQEFSVSLSVGSITQRLYGIANDIEWEP